MTRHGIPWEMVDTPKRPFDEDVWELYRRYAFGGLIMALMDRLARPDEFAAVLREFLDEHLGQSIAWQPSGGVCDGNNIAACGVPVVDTMGVRGGKIHSMEEYLIVESLKERAALSALTILRLSGSAA